MRAVSALDDAGERTLELAVRKMGLSARAHDRVLKVARTIADLEGNQKASGKNVAEAVQYRSLDNNGTEALLAECFIWYHQAPKGSLHDFDVVFIRDVLSRCRAGCARHWHSQLLAELDQ